MAPAIEDESNFKQELKNLRYSQQLIEARVNDYQNQIM